MRLSKGFQSDLHWWAVLLQDWNRVSLCDSAVLSQPSATVTSDASGHWGCGAFSSAAAWFQFQWPPAWGHFHITVKELLPVVAAWPSGDTYGRGGQFAACVTMQQLWQSFGLVPPKTQWLCILCAVCSFSLPSTSLC